MTESPVVAIKILKEIPLDGEGDTLYNRLRKVKLRGFPEVSIYETSQFEAIFFNSNQIINDLHTSQLGVYRTHLNRIARLAELFRGHGINILNLNCAYDYIAIHASNEETEWTMLPPVIERCEIPKTKDNRLDYASIISPNLQAKLKELGISFNPNLARIPHTSNTNIFDLINDGAHRIHYGFENGGIKFLRISSVKAGYPYYAAPKKYNIKVYQTREDAFKEAEIKVHILPNPYHKDLYRLFPSGGIKSGDVRK